MRKRRVYLASSVAKRIALALFLAGPGLLSAEKAPAAEKAPLLHVAGRIPDFAAVQKNANEPKDNNRHVPSRHVVGNQPVAALLTMANSGWIAREAIGKQVPLRDPSPIPSDDGSNQPAPAGDLPIEQESVTDKASPGEAAQSSSDPAELPSDPIESPSDPVALPSDLLEFPSDPVELPSDPVESPSDPVESPSETVELSSEAGDKNITAPGPISLETLKPVPLMAPETQQEETVTPRADSQTPLPVRRPAIESDDAAKREAVEAAPPARQPAVESKDDAPAVEPLQPVAPVLSASVARLQRPIEQCLNYYYQRPEDAAGRSSWGMMHAIMVYGVDTQVISGRKRYNAIAWLAGNNICRGKRLLTVDRAGISPRQGVGLQGHQGQLLAILGLVGVPTDYPLYVDRRKFTINDLIAHEQRECRRGEELTFTLIALAHYIDTESEWRSKDGERWDFERLLQEELAQPVIGAACGGTHRLMGLSHALRIRKEEGHPITGQWARADTFLQDFTDYAWKLQNRDGSMSTNWFEGRGDNGDVDRKIQTTGHVVEWMLSHLPDDQLQDERLVRAVRFLTAAMSNNPAREKEIGPKGHALRSLAVYHQRVFDAPDPWRSEATSSRSQTTRRGRSANR